MRRSSTADNSETRPSDAFAALWTQTALISRLLDVMSSTVSPMVRLVLLALVFLFVQDAMRASTYYSPVASAAAASAAAPADSKSAASGTSASASTPTSTPASTSSSDNEVFETPADQAAILAASRGGRVHVSFCTSCAYGGQFRQLKATLEQNFPGIEVSGSNYPVSLSNRLLSHVVTGVQIGTAALVFGGRHIFSYLGQPMPGFVEQLQVRRFAAHHSPARLLCYLSCAHDDL